MKNRKTKKTEKSNKQNYQIRIESKTTKNCKQSLYFLKKNVLNALQK